MSHTDFPYEDYYESYDLAFEELRTALADALYLISQGDFSNGVEHNGIDEGIVMTRRQVTDLCATLTKHGGPPAGHPPI